MKKALFVAGLVLAGCAAFAGPSSGGLVIVGDGCARQIVTAKEVVLRWQNPDVWELGGAPASAALRFKGLWGGTRTVAIGPDATEYAWTAFDGDAPKSDDVITVERVYFGKGGEELFSESAEVVLFRNSFTGSGTVSVSDDDRSWAAPFKARGIVAYGSDWGTFPPADPTSPDYSIVKAPNAVSPELSGTCGFTGWKMRRDSPWGYGVYAFSLVIPGSPVGERYDAEIEAVPVGSCLLIR